MNTKVFALLLIAVVGVFAEEYNCGAEGKVCQNGGICHDTVALDNTNNPGAAGNGWQTPFCICKAPYGGPDCSWTIRECKDSPCQNGGTCHPATCRAGGMNNYDCFTCDCPLGWTGGPPAQAAGNYGVCDWPQPINDCSVNVCANGGICTSSRTPQLSSYSCDCTDDWIGTGTVHNCTLPAFNCTTVNPCQNGATCQGNGASCQCVNANGYGWTGNTCSVRFCDANPCSNGATCHNGNDGTLNAQGCTCAPGWGGTFCTIPNFCNSNPCQNGASCQNSGTPGDGTCTSLCPSLYSGKYCQYPPFCQNNPCMNGAACSNGTFVNAAGAPGTGACVNCPDGFAGRFCEITLSGCATPNVDCTVAHTKTYNDAIPNNQQKTCPSRNQATYPITSPTTFPGFRCDCQQGSYGTGPGTKAGVYAYDCRCNSTYTPRCPNADAALLGSGGVPGSNVDMVCQNGATCFEHAEGTMCSCRPGFWGPACENYDNPCLNTPCKNGGQCSIIYETGQFKPVQTGNGVIFSFGQFALDDRFWGYMCQCKWPFYGENCELEIPRNPVQCTADNQCMNGGTCGPMDGNGYSGSGNLRMTVGNFKVITPPYTCTCNSNYTGQFCQTFIRDCINTPDYCMNGGWCIRQRGALDRATPACYCPCGFAGDRCELIASNADRTALTMLSGSAGGVGVRLDFCSNAPCQNGGSCYSLPNGQDFMCVCKSGFADRYCQTKVRSAAAGVVPSLLAVAAAIAVAFALKN